MARFSRVLRDKNSHYFTTLKTRRRMNLSLNQTKWVGNNLHEKNRGYKGRIKRMRRNGFSGARASKVLL